MNAELAAKMEARRKKSVILASSGVTEDEEEVKHTSNTWDIKSDLGKLNINVRGKASGFKGSSGVESAVRAVSLNFWS